MLNRCGLIVMTADGPCTALGLGTTYKGLDFIEGRLQKYYRARFRGRSLANQGQVEIFLAGEHPADLAWEIRGFLKGAQSEGKEVFSLIL